MSTVLVHLLYMDGFCCDVCVLLLLCKLKPSNEPANEAPPPIPILLGHGGMISVGRDRRQQRSPHHHWTAGTGRRRRRAAETPAAGGCSHRTRTAPPALVRVLLRILGVPTTGIERGGRRRRRRHLMDGLDAARDSRGRGSWASCACPAPTCSSQSQHSFYYIYPLAAKPPPAAGCLHHRIKFVANFSRLSLYLLLAK